MPVSGRCIGSALVSTACARTIPKMGLEVLTHSNHMCLGENPERESIGILTLVHRKGGSDLCNTNIQTLQFERSVETLGTG